MEAEPQSVYEFSRVFFLESIRYQLMNEIRIQSEKAYLKIDPINSIPLRLGAGETGIVDCW